MSLEGQAGKGQIIMLLNDPNGADFKAFEELGV